MLPSLDDVDKLTRATSWGILCQKKVQISVFYKIRMQDFFPKNFQSSFDAQKLIAKF